jgi:hypothetical protein
MPAPHNDLGREIVRDLVLMLIGIILVLKFVFGATLSSVLAQLSGWLR